MNIAIRHETPADAGVIRDVTRRAFAGTPYSDGTEPDIIDALRRRGVLSVSLVAEHEGTIVGHVAFSPAAADDESTGWYTLGPVAVAPEYQRRNIGQSTRANGRPALRSRVWRRGTGAMIAVGLR